MDFYDVVKTRRSVRSYSTAPLDPESLSRIADAVLWAPSACNRQPWTFRVIMDSTLRDNICSVYDAGWLRQAPAIVLAIGNKDLAWKRVEGTSIVEMDIGIAMEHFVLAAAAEGLSTCWICAYDIKKMSSVTGILPPWEVLAISPLGKADKTTAAPKRKQVEELFKIIN